MKIGLLSARLVLVLVLLGTVGLFGGACGGPANQAPLIASLSSEAPAVAPGSTATITCAAEDPDGDSLSYTWISSTGSISGSGDTVTWTAPGSTGAYSIRVSVTDGKGGTADKSLTITVSDEVEAANNPPVVTSLSASPTSIEPQTKTTVTCVAIDPDGDPLTYRWWSELGRFEGSGSTVTWVAPLPEGEYRIEVIVKDNRGSSAVESIEVAVAANELPEISRVRADPSVVVLDHTTTITCTAEDPDGDPLTYTWSATEGSLSGSGDVVTWTAPGRAGYYTIEVTVDDDRGGSTTSSVTVQAEGVEVTLPLKPVYNESGAVKSDGTVLTLRTVGDDAVDNGIRTYLSFDISKIAKLEEFRSAAISITTVDRNGTPWTDLGDLLIDEVDYGESSLQEDDYDLTGTRLERLDAPPTTEIDWTPLILRALSKGSSRLQIRIYFATETDGDSTADNIKISNAELKVNYVERTE